MSGLRAAQLVLGSVQCPQCAHARCTLRAPCTQHITPDSCQAPAALGASVNSRAITSETEIDVVSVSKTRVCFCIQFIFWIESNLNIVSYWIEQLYSKLMEMTLESIQRESFSTYTNLFSSNVSKHKVELLEYYSHFMYHKLQKLLM